MTLNMISTLNVDFDADRKAYRKLVRGRALLDQFPDHNMVETIYRVAVENTGEDTYLLQQVAIYEMNRPNGNLDKAANHLARASELSPHDSTITHSLAELQLKRAQMAKTDLQSTTYLQEAQRLAKSLTRPSVVGSHGFHTLAKVQLVKLSKLAKTPEHDWSEIEFGEVVKETEKVIQEGLQRFPGDSYLLVDESELAKLLSDDERAQSSLRIALNRNPTNPLIATRLAKVMLGQGRNDEALSIYKQSLAAGVNDKQVHFNYAKLLMDQSDSSDGDIEYHLRRSFTEGDSNIEGQFWYARQLYLNGSISDAAKRFRQLRDVSIDPKIKRALRGEIVKENEAIRFTGRVEHLEFNYAFITRDGESDRVFLSKTLCESNVWIALRRYVRVSFSIGFNFWGACAFDVALE